jgi:hypothetical protein
MLVRRIEERDGGDQFCHTNHRSNALQIPETNAMQESDEENIVLF